MIILITMAGQSSRFTNAGYPLKHTLELRPGLTLFEASLRSFYKLFNDKHLFLFVTRGVECTAFVRAVIEKMRAEFAIENAKYRGLSPLPPKTLNYAVCTLEGPTRGQAETAYLGIKLLKEEIEKYRSNILKHNIPGFDMPGYKEDNLVIFNIDTIRKHFVSDYKNMMYRFNAYSDHGADFSYVKANGIFDAFFDSDADEKKWSFCSVMYPLDGKTNKPTNHPMYVTATAEKKKISNWCSTGLYMFANPEIFMDAYRNAIKDRRYNYYIAPLYNKMKDVLILECPPDHVEFAGVPEDYEELRKKYMKSN